MRVVRVALSDEKRVIGIRYPECLVEIAEEAVREQKIIEAMQAVRTKKESMALYWSFVAHKLSNTCTVQLGQRSLVKHNTNKIVGQSHLQIYLT